MSETSYDRPRERLRKLVYREVALWGIGVVVDLSTGAGYELTPSSIFLKLEPATDGAAK